LLREHEGVSYSRFLALFAVQASGGSQRELARWLGLTEPSTSRMVAVLAGDGLVSVTMAAGGGNRRQLQLTTKGAALVERCGTLLEGRFENLVLQSGVPYRTYQHHTQRLLSQLDTRQQVDLLPPGTA
jgi:DNA-binding MarR family transcriptional regulator